MKSRKILVSNDDGLHAPGLAALVAALSTHHEVYVVAPDRERSGVGHGFTLFNPLRADPHPDRFPEGLAKSVHSCSGLPVDCVKMGLIELHKDVGIDLVVSGVNKGANMGMDTLYSGTVAAAREGVLNGVPGLAVSLVMRNLDNAGEGHPHFSVAADWALRLIGELGDELERGAREGLLFNLNVGNFPADEIDGWAWTDLARINYEDGYVKHVDPGGRPHYWLEGELDLKDERPDCDVQAVRARKASLSPVMAMPRAPEALARLRGS